MRWMGMLTFLPVRSASSHVRSQPNLGQSQLVGEVARYQDIYRYCCDRGPGGIIIGLVEELR